MYRYRAQNNTKYRSLDHKKQLFNPSKELDGDIFASQLHAKNKQTLPLPDAILKYGNDKIITLKEELPKKIKQMETEKRFDSPSVDHANSSVINDKRTSVDSTLQAYVKELQDVKKSYFDTVPIHEYQQQTQQFVPGAIKKPGKLSRLHYTPQAKQFTSPYLARDFRGLIISDNDEALNNCDTGNYQTLTSIDDKLTPSSRLKIGKRKSNATKELFPSPYDLTNHNIDTPKTLKNKRNDK